MEASKDSQFKNVEQPVHSAHFDVPPEIVHTTRRYKIVKRSMDIFGASIGLILLSPIFLVVSVIVRKDGGPVFFSQERVGKGGETFKMWKFRSMCVDAEEKLEELKQFNEIEGAMFKMKDDPRITRIGKIIRKTSIDELPQLWNVLRGDMTLVGPRPPITRELEEYTKNDLKRLTVKPGCSGLWQISGRNELSFDEMVELDIRYIENQSIRQDVVIIAKTVGILVKSVVNKASKNGAY
ncbi:MAG: sugar transferase [Lactobacillales bacterium]|nr:sugar transferase [Lactobacillales bacterium]